MAAFFLFNSYSPRKIQDRRRRRAPVYALGKPGQNLFLEFYCLRPKAYLISSANIRQPLVMNQPIQDGCQRRRHQNMLVKDDVDTLFSHLAGIFLGTGNLSQGS